MKNTKIFFTAICLLCCVALLAACGENTPKDTTGDNSTEADYTVTVRDALGQSYAGVIVRFMQNGQQVTMQVTDENGAVSKNLPKGEYTVELAFTGNDRSYYYDTADLKLTAEKTALTVELAYALSGEPVTLGAQGEQVDAYHVQTGCTWVNVGSQRSYYLFTPTEQGTYEFGVVGDATVGYYGAPHFVQSQNAAEVVDGKFTVSVSASMIGTGNTGTTVLVIGVDGAKEGTENCVLTVRRIGDSAFNPAEQPWVIYQPKNEVKSYTLPAGAKLQEFDLSAATGTYKLVLGSDGYYHLNSADGALVLVRLGQPSAYLEAIETILREYSGMGKYFYNENGEFVRKESYTECLLTYSDAADEETGVYPLNDDLKYMLEQRGEYVGWWNPDGNGFLFRDETGLPLPGVNPEHGMLFLCCYIEG